MKKIFSISIVLLFFNFSSYTNAQNVQSEIGFGIGVNIPSNDMEALKGLVYQLDYRLLNKNFGIQFSMNYLQNKMDDEYLMKIKGSNSINSENWRSVSGMLKLLGRVHSSDNKLLIDLSFGFGMMQSKFPSQSYNYDINYPEFVQNIAALNEFSSAFVLGGGLKLHYKFNAESSVGLGYDLQAAKQTYILNGTKFNGTIKDYTGNVTMYYSNFILGLNYFF